MTETIINERLHVSRPIDQDVTYVYRTRYMRDDESGTVRQEWQAIGGPWREYQGYEMIPIEPAITGFEEHQLRAGLAAIDEGRASELRRLRDVLNAAHLGV